MRRGRHHEGAQVAGARHACAPPALLVPMDEWRNAPRPAARLALPPPLPHCDVFIVVAIQMLRVYDIIIRR